jgi:hypothetical protein
MEVGRRSGCSTRRIMEKVWLSTWLKNLEWTLCDWFFLDELLESSTLFSLSLQSKRAIVLRLSLVVH